MRVLVLLITCLLGGSVITDETAERWVVSDKSNVKIVGSSNVNKFNCLLVDYSRDEELVSNEDMYGFKFEPGTISLRIDQFDCGHQVMNKDFVEALNGIDYPYIQLKLQKIDLRTELNGIGVFEVEISGQVKECVVMDLNLFKTIDTLVIRGKKAFSMRDFGIDPPSKLFGLIQVEDIITIDFDLVLNKLETPRE